MKTIFRAVGPAFKQGLLVEPFESVNVYPLLCQLLGITPEPHDGSLAVMEPMLRESAGTGTSRWRAPGTGTRHRALGVLYRIGHERWALVPSTGRASPLWARITGH